MSYDKMITKKEVCEIFGVTQGNKERKKIFEQLPQYENNWNKYAIFKLSDAMELLSKIQRKVC
ncbi:MAG: hypothetical protein ACWGHH_06630 [Sulfurovaceae bacterium]